MKSPPGAGGSFPAPSAFSRACQFALGSGLLLGGCDRDRRAVRAMIKRLDPAFASASWNRTASTWKSGPPTSRVSPSSPYSSAMKAVVASPAVKVSFSSTSIRKSRLFAGPTRVDRAPARACAAPSRAFRRRR